MICAIKPPKADCPFSADCVLQGGLVSTQISRPSSAGCLCCRGLDADPGTGRAEGQSVALELWWVLAGLGASGWGRDGGGLGAPGAYSCHIPLHHGQTLQYTREEKQWTDRALGMLLKEIRLPPTPTACGNCAEPQRQSQKGSLA